MRIVELLNKKSIELGANVATKDEAIDKLVALQVAGGKIKDAAEYKAAILAREEEGSTAIGEGIMTPHYKSSSVSGPSLAAMTVPAGVDCDSMDDEPTNIFFIIAAPEDGAMVHLEVLSRLMTMLMDENFRERLLAAVTVDEFLAEIDKMETLKYGAEEKAVVQEEPAKDGIRVLAVTACPTGIAHTYMAAEALEKAGEKMGITVKAETNGSGGAQNVLTDEEIAACDGIIVAADKAVEMSRFDGKPVLKTKVADGIKKPEELINTIVNGEAPVYKHTGAKAAAKAGDESFGRQVYKHLMNGISNMLPFVVAGGIFIALAFLIDTLSGAPQDGNFGSYTALAAWFKTIGGAAFNFMIPVMAGFIAKSIADRPGFLVGVVGGYLATTGATFASVGGDVPSGFLGALLAGFAGGFLMLAIEKACNGLPKALNGIKPVLIYPLAGLAMVALMMCAVNPIMGVINTGLNDFLASMGGSSKLILGLILGAMMSIDMGGPFNKAAYAFGVAAITAGNYDIMAAVMIGGMVPPIAIALATIFFKKKFTAEERKNGPVNFIMGLSFITEGAIPYAAADPARVIPSCMVGAGVAGALSMLFGCTLMAPHGGIFVFVVVGNWLMYFASLVIGSVVGALLMGLLKKTVVEE